MKKLFYAGLAGLALFESANVYFIMPMPGSQEMDSIDIAYFLYSWRWFFRICFGVLLVLGIKHALSKSKWIPVVGLIGVVGLAYAANFKMAADTMFYQPTVLAFKDANDNEVDPDRLVLGITHNGQAKAYPIQFLGYHHQVRDSIGGKPVMVTYCTVCRTGRVFEPLVNGQMETFRLVGMDHFNAMFEDKTTKSWWRQVTGEAIAGKLKGRMLPEFPYAQTTLHKWMELYPNTLVMQPDTNFQAEYERMKSYERGRLTGKLTRMDTLSWQSKSWVIGIADGDESKAYDWNALKKERILYDKLGKRPIALILSKDDHSFVALERINDEQVFTLKDDTLISANNRYSFLGTSLDKSQPDLKRIHAYQEYWHSWQTFHPAVR